MKGIYLASFKAEHKNYNIVYQDINGKRDLAGDMLEIDLTPYDFIIATPPCNYWSRANYRRETSEYSQKTKHLLPGILKKLENYKKPFIVENVRNTTLFEKNNMFDFNVNTYCIGRHTYWTNVSFTIGELLELHKKQTNDFYQSPKGTVRLKKNSQGGDNVSLVIEKFLEKIHGG